MISSEGLKKELAQCYGTQNYYRYVPFSLMYTDGVKLFVEKAEAYWLLSDIAINLVYGKELQNEYFLCITLKVKDNKADLIFDDGNGNVLLSKHYKYTDCPEGDWKFYFTDNVLLIPNEY